jgi:hypothetical protein
MSKTAAEDDDTDDANNQYCRGNDPIVLEKPRFEFLAQFEKGAQHV